MSDNQTTIHASVSTPKFSAELSIIRHSPASRVKSRKWDYLRLPDGEYRYWPKAVEIDGYYVQASRNSVLVYQEYPNRVFRGAIYRTDRFEVKDNIDAPESVKDAALTMYDDMLVGTLNQNRTEGQR